jgi:hypothetical protein
MDISQQPPARPGRLRAVAVAAGIFVTLERSLSPLEGHGGTFSLGLPYHLFVVLFGFAPWTLYWPGAVSAAPGQPDRRAFPGVPDGVDRAVLPAVHSGSD